MKLTRSEENYVKNIFNLQQKADNVNTNALSSALKTSAASVTDMLKKLKTKKLIDYKKYYGVKLNATGRKEALKIVRRHRLWEFFLVEKLGMQWEKVHPIAEELEHVGDGELIRHLDIFLQQPRTDPHGDPIPDAKGILPQLKQVMLKDFPVKKNGIIKAVSDQAPHIMEMCNHYGIAIGTTIRILKKFNYDDSIEVKIGRKPARIISGATAQNIFVYEKR